MTIDGAASFDDVQAYGLSTRSPGARSAPLRRLGAVRTAERTTTHAQATGARFPPTP